MPIFPCEAHCTLRFRPVGCRPPDRRGRKILKSYFKIFPVRSNREIPLYVRESGASPGKFSDLPEKSVDKTRRYGKIRLSYLNAMTDLCVCRSASESWRSVRANAESNTQSPSRAGFANARVSSGARPASLTAMGLMEPERDAPSLWRGVIRVVPRIVKFVPEAERLRGFLFFRRNL